LKEIGKNWDPAHLEMCIRVSSSFSPVIVVPYCSAGTYLGIEVAIKEVLPSKDYDVAKYFEREWRLMK
jgi:hypothetical protein